MLHTYTGKNRCARDSTPSAAALGRELGPNGARPGQDFTYGQVRLDLSEPVCSHVWRTLARFSST